MGKKEINGNIKIILYMALFFGIFAVFMVGYSQGWNQSHIQLNKLDWESKYIFLCNSYHDGKGYDEEPCGIFYINATGNYCDGEIVCKNRFLHFSYSNI